MQFPVSLASILKDIEGVTLASDELESDYSATFAELPEPAEDAKVVEGDRLTPHAVPPSDFSGFTHFSDGAQFSRPAFYERGLPGRYAFLNAAVAARRDREVMDVMSEASADGIYAPACKSMDAIRQATAGELDVHDVRVGATDGMARMAQLVADAISAERNRLERQTCLAWLRLEEEGKLLVDGTIGQLIGAVTGPTDSVVGLVKSHRKQYFTADTAATILGLQEGERSSVFVVPSRREQDSETHSWYLRLRSDPYKSPAFGLVRIEVPPVEVLSDTANEISGWVLAERSPLSLPDLRYDRLLYPIRVVELLLKSRHPSRQSIQSLIGV
ncbi:MAG: DNA double-strand break repair nuclease NurA [Fimbriimonadales bacterium]